MPKDEDEKDDGVPVDEGFDDDFDEDEDENDSDVLGDMIDSDPWFDQFV